MLLDGVYNRKRRDTFNEHALPHQTVAPSSYDPEELPLTPTIASITAEVSGSGQRASVSLHEERSGKSVHVPLVHADGPGPVETATAPASPGSTTPSQPVSLHASVVSSTTTIPTTNHSHDPPTHTTIAANLTSSSSASVDSDSALVTGTSPPFHPPAVPPDGTSGHQPAREIPPGDDYSADFDGPASTSKSSGVAETSGIATTTSASGRGSAKLGADSTDHEHEVPPIVGGSTASDCNVDYSGDADLADGAIVESTTAATAANSHPDQQSKDRRLDLSNSDRDADGSDSPGELLVPVEVYREEVSVAQVSSDVGVNDEIMTDAPEGTIGDGRSKTSSSSDVVKEMQELSRESSSSESSEASSNVVKAGESTEELQRDYPMPVYSYGQDEVEIVKLQKSPNAPAERHPVDSVDPGVFNDEDVRTNAVSQKERDKGELRVITRQGSDEETLRKFEQKFHAASGEINDSGENPLPVPADPNSAAADVPRETVHDSLDDAPDNSNTDHLSGPPMIQRVQIVEVPVYHDDTPAQPPPSSPSSSLSPHRVLINITIASEDSSASSRPLYVLSVSVPTEADTNGLRGSGININQAQVHTAERPPEEAASMLKKIGSIEQLDTMRLPPPPQPPASPPAPIWAGGECECSCPCMGSSSDEWDNFSAFDESLNEEQLEKRVNSTLSTGESPEGTRDQEQQEKSSPAPGLVRNAISTADHQLSSTVRPVEANESTSEITSTDEVSTNMWACSGTTPLPPEPVILILEGEASFT